MTESDRRVAVISGGTSGIGFACAQKLLETGQRVAIFSERERDVAAAQKALAEVAGPDDVLAVPADLRSPGSWTRFRPVARALAGLTVNMKVRQRPSARTTEPLTADSAGSPTSSITTGRLRPPSCDSRVQDLLVGSP